MGRSVIALLLAVLAILAVLRSAFGTRLDSFTIDEPWHIVAGTAYVRGGDRHLNPEHPPLAKLWVGAWMPADFKLGPEPALREKVQEREWVEQTMFEHNDPERAQRRARIAMWSLNGLLLFALGLLLWRAAGRAWAVGTLAFLAIEPTIGAHLPVVMTDGVLALTFALVVVAAGLLVATWRWRWVAVFGVAVGLALGAKHSALAGLVGVGIVLAAAALSGGRRGGWREAARRGAKLAAGVVLGVALLWAQYGFRFHADAGGGDGFNLAMDAKIAEVTRPALRGAIAVADDLHLLPRAYLWGLADTVRTGIEGRGGALHLVWGKVYEGRTPWFTWPAILAAKIPIALMALSLLGLALLPRAPLSPAVRWMLAALAAASALHFAALAVSPQAWGGVRHATPLIAAAAVLGGGALAEAWRRRSRVLLGTVAVLFVAAFAMTIREPRLWEYHNELVGGTAGGYRAFRNEGVDLGQRFGEIREFHDRVIAGSGQPLYVDYMLIERQARAARLGYRRFVESLDDTNAAGVWDGWFVYTAIDELPWPQVEWDPAEVFKDMEKVAEFGNVRIWHGRLTRPKTRASSIAYKVMDYLYKENGQDSALVARRLEEVVAVRPEHVAAGVELGNAYLRLGDGAGAARAYRRLLEQKKVPLDGKVERQLRDQLAHLEGGEDPAKIKPMRNPWME
ncbi:hypothetical protein GCM10027084_24780 [Pseudoxanthomonas sangjuensis]|uniref:phospholipid carrier-dependent glycosyltransferase n=1 Tax=Pseudoxanthomonas sangjuensis TaxID=1503750 RepID=UPI00139150B5|nr:phospholipid carrier-dependent glycosyltransferase [Pseudoxanthomonas sangjuensis]KAF1711044.1 hypothetical protein CSC71_10110 [Pseudoxanthomonas sangjuensis]